MEIDKGDYDWGRSPSHSEYNLDIDLVVFQYGYSPHPPKNIISYHIISGTIGQWPLPNLCHFNINFMTYVTGGLIIMVLVPAHVPYVNMYRKLIYESNL